jgi:hypothetical protein
MRIIKHPVSLLKIWNERETAFEEVLKIVVDITRNHIAVDAEMHADLEQLLLKEGSVQQDLWGANIYPLRSETDQIEYTSLINIRPAIGNRSMEVADPGIREKIHRSVTDLLI